MVTVDIVSGRNLKWMTVDDPIWLFNVQYLVGVMPVVVFSVVSALAWLGSVPDQSVANFVMLPCVGWLLVVVLVWLRYALASPRSEVEVESALREILNNREVHLTGSAAQLRTLLRKLRRTRSTPTSIAGALRREQVLTLFVLLFALLAYNVFIHRLDPRSNAVLFLIAAGTVFFERLLRWPLFRVGKGALVIEGRGRLQARDPRSVPLRDAAIHCDLQTGSLLVENVEGPALLVDLLEVNRPYWLVASVLAAATPSAEAEEESAN